MNIGLSSTIFTFIALLISIIFYAYSELRNKEYIKFARWAFYISGILILFQSAYLYYGIFTHQFHWDYVFSYTSKDLSLYYLISTFWAGQEGTFLLWLLLGSSYGLVVAKKRDSFEPVVMVFILVVQAFIAFILIKQNPFAYLWEISPENFIAGQIPLDGRGLNPLLQDPWMIIHPPILFVGYSAAVLLFAYAMAGLYYKDYDKWLTDVYPYGIFTALMLGAGIILGGYWAYTTLGWGGYWGWDPVENSSLIPWITSLAFIHSALIQKRQNALKRTNFFMAIITFILVLWGSFLTRSGVLADFSVHSFADEGINQYLINFVLFFVLFGFGALIVRFKDIKADKLSSDLLTRGNMMLYGFMALLISGLLTLLGTNAPLLSGLFYENPSAIAIEYYNMVNAPITILIVITIAISSVLSWRKEGGNLKQAVMIHGSVSVIFTAIVAIFWLHEVQSLLIFLFSLFAVLVSGQLVFRLLKKKNMEFGGYLTHLGFGLMLIGIITSSVLDRTTKANLPLGKPVPVWDYEMTYKGFFSKPGEKAVAVVNVKLPDGSEYDAEMKYYWSEYNRAYMRNPFVHVGLTKDTYTSPIQIFKSKHNQTESGKLITLVKNETKSIDDLNMKFLGYEMAGGEMGGQMVVNALINITLKGKTTLVKPALQVNEGNRKSIAAHVPESNLHIEIKDINVGNSSLTISLVDHNDPGSKKEGSTETISIDITEKPFINVLWLGTILIILGMSVSQYRNYRNSKSS